MNVGSDRLRIHMIAQEAGLVPSSAGAYPASIAPRVQADVALFSWHRDPNEDPFTTYLDQAMPAPAGVQP